MDFVVHSEKSINQEFRSLEILFGQLFFSPFLNFFFHFTSQASHQSVTSFFISFSAQGLLQKHVGCVYCRPFTTRVHGTSEKKKGKKKKRRRIAFFLSRKHRVPLAGFFTITVYIPTAHKYIKSMVREYSVQSV